MRAAARGLHVFCESLNCQLMKRMKWHPSVRRLVLGIGHERQFTAHRRLGYNGELGTVTQGGFQS